MVFGVILLLAGPAMAQGSQNGPSGQIDNLRMEMERTDQVIEQARQAVQESRSETGQIALDQAKAVQTQAWEQFRKGNAYGYGQAAKLTVVARELAQKAIAASRMGSPTEENEDIVLRKLERVRQLLDRAREEIAGTDNSRVRTLYQSARDNLDQAWEFYRASQYRPAVKLCNQVENAVRKMLAAAQQQKRGESQFERRAEQVQSRLEKQLQQMSDCGSENGQKLFEQAREMYRKALQMADQNNPGAAQKQLQQARRLANQANEECRNGDALQQRLQTMTQKFERLQQQVEQNDDLGQRLMNQIREQLQIAEKEMVAHHNEGASAAIKAAQLFMNQLANHLKLQQGQ
jgi:hemoglobin-like flavoprotein